MTKRRHISTTERLAILERENRICHLCGQPIKPTDAWDVSHEVPLELGGADEGTNLKAAHRPCHRQHTATIDAERISRAQRQEARHVGAKAPAKQPIRSAGFPHKPRRQPRPAVVRVKDVYGRRIEQ